MPWLVAFLIPYCALLSALRVPLCAKVGHKVLLKVRVIKSRSLRAAARRGRSTTPTKNYLTAKVQQSFQPVRLRLCASRPNNVTIIKMWKNVRFEIKEKKRSSEIPRKPSKEIETTGDLPTDHVDVITPSKSVIDKNTNLLEHSHLFYGHAINF